MMIDKILERFFGSIDTLTEWLFGKRCECKRKKPGKNQ